MARIEFYTFIQIEQSGDDVEGFPVYSVRNSMFQIEIGRIEKHSGLYAYQPVPEYWHQGTVISQINMEDILSFIQSLNNEAYKLLGKRKDYYTKPFILRYGIRWEG